MIARRDPNYRLYKKMRETVISMQKKYEKVDSLDIAELTGGPMRKVLQKKIKK